MSHEQWLKWLKGHTEWVLSNSVRSAYIPVEQRVQQVSLPTEFQMNMDALDSIKIAVETKDESNGSQ